MKNNTKIVIAFILGLIISGVTVYAVTTITADQVSYDENNTVKDKIDDLYLSAKKLRLIGTANLDSVHYGSDDYYTTIDLSSYDNYQSITENDIYIMFNGISPASTNANLTNTSGTVSIVKEYNQQTGILTVTLPLEVYSKIGVWVSIDIYLYK